MGTRGASLSKESLSLAVPSILANITVPLVGLVDIFVAGHLPAGDGGAAATIGGVTIGTMLFDLLYWNFGFLRIGTGGLTAQAYGRGDGHSVAVLLCRGVALALLCAVAILVIQRPFARLGLLLVNSSHIVMDLALNYFAIRIWAAPATLSLFALKGWFIGVQDTVSSMTVDLVVNAFNMTASLVLSLGLGPFRGMGFKGIAFGTVVAQYSGLVAAALILLLKYRVRYFAGLRKDILRTILDPGQLRSFLTMNSNLFIRSLCLVAVYVGFTAISAGFGEVLLSVGGILMKLLLLFSYFTDGFAYAAEAMVGKYIGMGDGDKVRGSVRTTFAWSMGIGMLFVALYLLGGGAVVDLLTSDSTVRAAARPYLYWLLLMPPAGCAAFTWDGVFVGATASVDLRNSTLLCVLSFFAIWYGAYLITGSPVPETGLHVLLAAYFAHLFTRSVYLGVRYKKVVPFVSVPTEQCEQTGPSE